MTYEPLQFDYSPDQAEMIAAGEASFPILEKKSIGINVIIGALVLTAVALGVLILRDILAGQIDRATMFTFAGMACAAGAIIGVAIAYSYIGRRATKALSKDVNRVRHWQVRISDKGLAMRNGDSRIQHAWGAVDQVLLADEMVILRFSGGIFPLTARTLPDDVSINDAKARIDEWRAE